MDRTRVMRRALWATVIYNLGAALPFAFPSSLGALAGFPLPVPRVYTALLGFFVLLFAGAYLWLALQPRIDRPLVALTMVGKAGVFVLLLVHCLLGDLPGRAVLAGSGDLFFAVVFAWWLVGTRAS